VATEDFLQDVQVRQSPSDPLLAPLHRVRGKVEFDGMERVSSQSLLDMLEVPQRSRTAGTYRRLCEVDGGARVGRCASARPDARRLQGASSRVLTQTSPAHLAVVADEQLKTPDDLEVVVF
jgi:hypothetical protein